MKQFRDSRYWVSKDGRVFRHFPEYNHTYITNHYGANGVIKKSPITRKRPEKWKEMIYRDNGYGYLQCSLSINNKHTKNRVHRMVAELYVSGYFEGAHVDHIDNNKINNHYTNLQWCTKAYNQIKRDDITFPLYSEWSK